MERLGAQCNRCGIGLGTKGSWTKADFTLLAAIALDRGAFCGDGRAMKKAVLCYDRCIIIAS